MQNNYGCVAVVGPAAQLPGHQYQTGERIKALVREIDELSRIMTPWGFKNAIRQLGYDVDACPDTLRRRGVDA
ncbi:hypothetical protein [Mesorhizobium sp. B2-3-4]|uniref:hypothetical protein n=1 Tax=Mesorhizobium sp. B2-3-4 TaxID=2589959 RepID=UPI00112BF109|nr:hypothetical protein [Mesorhizobium sp. B2-3-4]TPM41405.1 hypothetical protein FJ967_00260 [Mesorhizobium sp. B2-3-4]